MTSLRPLALAALCGLLAPRPARAGISFSIGDAALAPGIGEQIIAQIAPQLAGQGLGPSLEQALDQAIGPSLQALQADINGRVAALDIDPFLRAMSGAAASSANILPLDHAGEPSFLSLGASFGGALNTARLADLRRAESGLVDGNLPDIGVGAAVALSLGLRLEMLHLPPLGYLDFDRLELEVTAMSVDLARVARGFDPRLSDDVAAPYLNLGLHGQYLLLGGHSILPGGLLRWGGLKVGTGVHYSRLQVSFAGALPGGESKQDFLWQGVRAGLLEAWQGSATLHATTQTLSVPVQASTSLQLLYLLTVFGGVAAEANFGGSSLALDGVEPAHVAIVAPSGAALPVANPEAQLVADASGRPALGDLRAFCGAQLNLWALALFGQGSVDTARSYSALVGARLFW